MKTALVFVIGFVVGCMCATVVVQKHMIHSIAEKQAEVRKLQEEINVLRGK